MQAVSHRTESRKILFITNSVLILVEVLLSHFTQVLSQQWNIAQGLNEEWQAKKKLRLDGCEGEGGRVNLNLSGGAQLAQPSDVGAAARVKAGGDYDSWTSSAGPVSRRALGYTAER